MSIGHALQKFFEQGGKGTNEQLATKFGCSIHSIRSFICQINKKSMNSGLNFMITKIKHPKKHYATYCATYQGYLKPCHGRPRKNPQLVAPKVFVDHSKRY